MKNISKVFGVLLLAIGLVTACTNTETKEEGGMVLDGTIKDLSSGQLVVGYKYSYDNTKIDTLELDNGKFSLKGNYPEPVKVIIGVMGKNTYSSFYVVNGEMTFTAHSDSLRNAIIVGDIYQEDKARFDKQRDEFMQTARSRDTTKSYAERAEDRLALSRNFERQFIKENPTSHYSVSLVKMRAPLCTIEELDDLISLLDPATYKLPSVIQLREKLQHMQNTEIPYEDFVTNTAPVKYQLDKTYIGDKHTGVIYLGVFQNGNICTLLDNGDVNIIDSAGNLISSFKPETKAKASSIAVDAENNIYLLSNKVKKEKRKVRGRTHMIDVSEGVNCDVYATDGVKKNQFAISDLRACTGARIMDGKLFIADFANKCIKAYDCNTGEFVVSIDDLRTCCGLLDFGISNNNELLVANLGAFRVNKFNVNGKNISSFGQRGSTIDDFHGCCNPVSVAGLPNGAVVTVEKDPTRIKVYSKEGVVQVPDIEELVEGCQHIPIAVDQQNNIYLASKAKGLIKCVLL